MEFKQVELGNGQTVCLKRNLELHHFKTATTQLFAIESVLSKRLYLLANRLFVIPQVMS